ncbi:nicotinate mononucleotide-dependent phosphoribosyltransferase CobT [Coleofasciculus sp.]|uniref:nicotinate mononucleotide-dependent phosphoribosyltransferase CobT n=1 Tax=Coleofasciculus sp. TaxID=3100458 RepID=UPI003A3C421D
MIRIYTQFIQANQWLQQYRGQPPLLACILGFTATGLIPGISAAGATPEDRKYTAIADAEFLVNGFTPSPKYPLPPLDAGASPVLISRAVVEACHLPVYLFNAGLPQPPAVPAIDLGGLPANCLTTGKALPISTVKQLFEQGLTWGQKLATLTPSGYVMIAECVVGGTTTALSVLTGLGIAAMGKVNSSHPHCNHRQKAEIVRIGLQQAGWEEKLAEFIDPFELVAAVGDPMQITAAGMVIGASQSVGVLLAGGTQMLAVYALARTLALLQEAGEAGGAGGAGEAGEAGGAEGAGGAKLRVCRSLDSLQWQPKQVVVGTTRWVADDPTGDTVGLARAIGGVPLLATDLSFAQSSYPQLRAYEQGYVKEGVGAGGCAIASHLYPGWNTTQLLQAIEALLAQHH